MSDRDERLLALTDLLLGAVYADGKLRDAEEEAVREQLRTVLGELTERIEERIKTFPVGTFDLEATAARFAEDPPVSRRKLLELLAAVRDADGEIDLSEDAYMRRVAEAVGLKPEDYADLTLDYEVEVLRASAASLAEPPPVPDDAR